jgi:hypothetical protein
VIDKTKLVERLRVSLKAAHGFGTECGLSLEAIEKAIGFPKVKLLDEAVDAIVVDESKRRYLSLSAEVLRLLVLDVGNHPDRDPRVVGPAQARPSGRAQRGIRSSSAVGAGDVTGGR